MLNKGTKLDPRNLTAAEIAPTASIEVVKRLRSTPFGENYLGSQGNTKLLLTSFEPDFVTERETRDRLMQSLATAGASRHDSLLTTFGSIEVSGTLIAVRAYPGCPSLKNFIDRRKSRGKEISPETAIGIIIEVAHALCALHPTSLHGFVNSETVFLSKTGKVLLGGLGEMPLLRSGSILREAYASGVLPMPPPELRGNSPKPTQASDIFFLGSLFVELITGKCVTAAGDDMATLRTRVAPALRDIFVACCAAQASSRPADAFEFLDMLAKYQVGSAADVAEPAAAGASAGAPAAGIQDPPSADAFTNLGALAPLDDGADRVGASTPTVAGPATLDMLDAGASIGLGVPTLDSPVDDGGAPGLSSIGIDEPREAISLSNMDSSPNIPSAAASGLSSMGISLDMVDADVRLVVVVAGIDEGPYDLDTIRSRIRDGSVTPASLVGELGHPTQRASDHPATRNMFSTDADGAVALVSMDASGPESSGPSIVPESAPTLGLNPDSIGLDFSGSPASPRPPSGPSIAATGDGAPPRLAAAGPAAAEDVASPGFTPEPAPTNRARKSRGTSAAGTFGWLFLTLILFAVTAWVMWQRQGSGG